VESKLTLSDHDHLRLGSRPAVTRDMTYVITQKCIGTCDSACVDVCPVGCIVGPVAIDELRATPPGERGLRFPGLQLFIDADECTCCGACLPECPADAIYHENDLPTAHRGDLARNAEFFARRG
jgi:ferredoxin